ncbi:MAG: hypothetical protein FP814_10695 [Desulfobacterium sp.]|nr:hypothetical protein [Desulfobacteraceae bacterium]MBA3036945.1 hypothetical protein [Desulfobacterium sp.]
MLKRILLILIISIFVPVLSSGAEYKVNDGTYDQRFSSPEKTFALYKKLLLSGDLKIVTECLMPHRAEQYYNLLTELHKANKLEEFAKGLPDNIRLESEYDPYYDYAMIAEQDGKKFSFVVQFIKIPSGIYLLDGM